MSDRTDLFKALNHLVATLAAYGTASHREDVTLEVGDISFRALSDAMDAAPHMAAKFYGDKFVLKTQSGRVVIRKRLAKAVNVDGAWLSEETARRLHEETAALRARNATQDQKRQEGAIDPNTPCFTSAYQRAACMLPWGHSGPHDHGPPAEETKPPARAHLKDHAPGCHGQHQPHEACDGCYVPSKAHLKECVLDTDHKSPCDVGTASDKSQCPYATLGCYKTAWPCALCRQEQAASAPTSPTLSPRQALGEALALLQRVDTLLGTRGIHEPSETGYTARGHVHDAIRRVRAMHEAAK